MTQELSEFKFLYLFGFSEITGNHLERLLPILKGQIKKGSQIGIVLIHDGVIGINKRGRITEAMEELLSLKVTLYAMIPDLKARGINLEQTHEKIKPIEYDDLIDLLDNKLKIVSWM
jgi:sulfur relay protein TusB/DsrH